MTELLAGELSRNASAFPPSGRMRLPDRSSDVRERCRATFVFCARHHHGCASVRAQGEEERKRGWGAGVGGGGAGGGHGEEYNRQY